MASVFSSQEVALAWGLGAVAVAFFALKAYQDLNTNEKQPRRQILSLDTWKPIVGDIPELLKNEKRLHEWMAAKSLEFHGEPWRVYLPGMRNLVVITDPALIEEITITQFDNFPRGEMGIGILTDLFGSSLMTWDGDNWHRQRKASAKFFTAKALRVCMTTNMQRNMDQMYGVIDETTAKAEAIDLLKLFHEFALQTFAEVGLGVDMKIIGSDEGHPMEHAVEDVTPVIMRRYRLPQWIWKLERWLGIGPERVIPTAMGTVREWLTDVVNESLAAATRRQAASGQTKSDSEIKSVVELFLEQSAEDKEGLRSEDLVDFILTFVLAARSTSALALGWTFLMLEKHPRVAERLQDELTTAFPAARSMYLTTEHLSELPYLEAVIKEVLRLYPVLPLNQKECVRDTVLGGDMVVKKGEIVAIANYAMARLPSVWGPDAAEFKPERWFDENTGKLISESSSKFTAFGTGPRICIGMKLAMLELRVVMANLLSRYEFTMAAPNDLSHLVAIELMPVAPVMMHAQKRTQ